MSDRNVNEHSPIDDEGKRTHLMSTVNCALGCGLFVDFPLIAVYVTLSMRSNSGICAALVSVYTLIDIVSHIVIYISAISIFRDLTSNDKTRITSILHRCKHDVFNSVFNTETALRCIIWLIAINLEINSSETTALYNILNIFTGLQIIKWIYYGRPTSME
jgi:hypothetical protein